MSDRVAIRDEPSEATSLSTTDLWTQMDRIFDDLRDELFGTFGPTPARRGGRGADPWASPYLPALTDVEDTGTAYELHANVPGIPKERIDVRVHGNIVQIRAESETTQRENERTFVRRERVYRGFQRVFHLPEPVVGEKVEAKYQDGVLTVTVPKAHPLAERKVPVS